MSDCYNENERGVATTTPLDSTAKDGGEFLFFVVFKHSNDQTD